MFTYALAKGVRMGYLPSSDAAAASHAWEGIQQHFVTANPDGTVTLHGTVKVGGLGGTPYRSGTFDYYIHEPIVDQDAKGVGAFLLAGSEMEQASTVPAATAKKAALLKSSKDYRSTEQPAAHRITAMVDAWFNSQTRKDAFGQTELYHYKWNDDSNNGFSFFGRAFRRYGATLATLPEAPTAAGLAKVQVYIIASPDIPSRIQRPTTSTKPAATPSKPGSRPAASSCSSPTIATTPSSSTSIRSATASACTSTPSSPTTLSSPTTPPAKS